MHVLPCLTKFCIVFMLLANSWPKIFQLDPPTPGSPLLFVGMSVLLCLSWFCYSLRSGIQVILRTLIIPTPKKKFLKWSVSQIQKEILYERWYLHYLIFYHIDIHHIVWMLDIFRKCLKVSVFECFAVVLCVVIMTESSSGLAPIARNCCGMSSLLWVSCQWKQEIFSCCILNLITHPPAGDFFLLCSEGCYMILALLWLEFVSLSCQYCGERVFLTLTIGPWPGWSRLSPCSSVLQARYWLSEFVAVYFAWHVLHTHPQKHTTAMLTGQTRTEHKCVVASSNRGRSALRW